MMIWKSTWIIYHSLRLDMALRAAPPELQDAVITGSMNEGTQLLLKKRAQPDVSVGDKRCRIACMSGLETNLGGSATYGGMGVAAAVLNCQSARTMKCLKGMGSSPSSG